MRGKKSGSCRSVQEVSPIPSYEPQVMSLVLINLILSFASLTDLSSNRLQSEDLFLANFVMSGNSVASHILRIFMPTCWLAPLALINRGLWCGNSKLTRSLASQWMWCPHGREPLIHALNPSTFPLLPLKAFFHALALLDISIHYGCLVFQMQCPHFSRASPNRAKPNKYRSRSNFFKECEVLSWRLIKLSLFTSRSWRQHSSQWLQDSLRPVAIQCFKTSFLWLTNKMSYICTKIEYQC